MTRSTLCQFCGRVADPDARVFFGTVGPFCDKTCRESWLKLGLPPAPTNDKRKP